MSRRPATAAVPSWRGLAVLAAAAAVLQGCAQERRAEAPAARVYAVDLQGGSRLCTVPGTLRTAAGETAEAQMVVGNDGGWCGIPVAQQGQRPYAAGLVTARPANGRVHVHTVGNQTRVDYLPDRGFSGTDSFAVRLLPGGAGLRVAVTVQATEPVVTPAAATPPAPPPARPAAPSPARPRR